MNKTVDSTRFIICLLLIELHHDIHGGHLVVLWEVSVVHIEDPRPVLPDGLNVDGAVVAEKVDPPGSLPSVGSSPPGQSLDDFP